MKNYELPRDSKGVAVQVVQPNRTLNFTFGTTATTATGAVQTNAVRLWSSADAHVKWVPIATGTDVAATTDMPITKEVAEYIGAIPGYVLSARIYATATETAASMFVTEPG